MPEFTKNQPEQLSSSKLLFTVVFATGVIFVYLFGLTIPLLGPDEPRYAQVAREMFESGDWITPRLGGFNWFEKPALLYWLQAASYSIFGINEFAARFGSALCGLGTIASLFWLGRHAGVTEEARNGLAATIALVACSSIGIIVFARGASFDIVVTFPLTLSLTAFFVFYRTGSTLPLVLFYVSIGVALLAKGLIGIVFPIGIVAIFYLFSLELPSRKSTLSLLWGLPLALAVAAIWYIPVYLQNGWAFVEEFFIGHHFERFTSNKYKHPQPFYFFFWVLPLMIFPWTPFLFAELWRRVSHRLTGTKWVDDSTSVYRFALAWITVPLAFFSLSGSKLPGYILPAVPPAIIIASLFLHRRAVVSRRWRIGVAAGAAAILAAIVIALATIVPRFAESDSVKSLISQADERGLSGSKVIMFYTLSHNAEWYAAGRLLRDEAGRQRTFYRTDELAAVVGAGPRSQALVLVPLEHLSKLTSAEQVAADVIADNTEHAIVAVTPRQPADARRNRSMSAAPIPVSATVSQ